LTAVYVSILRRLVTILSAANSFNKLQRAVMMDSLQRYCNQFTFVWVVTLLLTILTAQHKILC